MQTLNNTISKSLPIEAYLYTGDQRKQIDSARDILISHCMKQFGFIYATPRRSANQRSQTAHRYDVVDPTNGYRSPDHSAAVPSASPISPNMATVLTGGPGQGQPPTGGSATYNGTVVPPGGCTGEADRQLTAQGGTIADPDLAVSINFNNYERSMNDDRLKAVFREWSGCMKAKGFAYGTPDEAMKDKRWLTGAMASPQEIATATADSTCRQQTDIVGAWFTVESAYEAQDIHAKANELAQIKQGMDAVLKNAASVNSGATS